MEKKDIYKYTISVVYMYSCACVYAYKCVRENALHNLKDRESTLLQRRTIHFTW